MPSYRLSCTRAQTRRTCPGAVERRATRDAARGVRRLATTGTGVLLVWLACAGVGLTLARADSLTSAIYVRTDTDQTVVVSPRAHAGKRLDDRTQLDVSYAADVWTSASIDIRASASKAVTEQRNELDVAASRELDDMTFDLSYRYSAENDYESHGASAGSSIDLANKSATLALGIYLFQDDVGRSGDPTFSRALSTLGGRLTFTQVIDTQTLAQLTYEHIHLDGYQASPYRVVGIGGTGFGCYGASLCLPEHQPNFRTKHALAALVRRAFSDTFSFGVNYRFFADDWGLTSHTVALSASLLASENTLLTLRYRFYTQTGVSFYSAVYRSPPDPKTFTTRDREQSPMHDQRIGLDLEQRSPLGDDSMRLVTIASVGADFYEYDNFVGLKRVRALELTLSVGLER